jgi:pimeloyl-ACP methyl ester carboxylesterase
MTNQNTPIIIILHGWGHSSSLWRHIVNKLEQIGLEVVCDDLPGFGAKIDQAIDFDINQYASWFVAHYGEIIKTRKVILIGHSLGGRIAIELAQNNPLWLIQLILIGTPAIYQPSNKTKIFKTLSFLKSVPGISNLVSSINPEYEAAKKNNLKETYQNVVEHDQKNVINKIKTPTLLIWGDQDFVVPISIANQIQKSIKDSKLKILAGQGHNPHIDNPNLLFGTIRNYLKSL